MKSKAEAEGDLAIQNSEAPAADIVADIALDDWTASKSRALGRRIEALSAFYKRCQREGLGRAAPQQFEDRFLAFLSQPV